VARIIPTLGSCCKGLMINPIASFRGNPVGSKTGASNLGFPCLVSSNITFLTGSCNYPVTVLFFSI
jgi:hypothetical protein